MLAEATCPGYTGGLLFQYDALTLARIVSAAVQIVLYLVWAAVGLAAIHWLLRH